MMGKNIFVSFKPQSAGNVKREKQQWLPSPPPPPHTQQSPTSCVSWDVVPCNPSPANTGHSPNAVSMLGQRRRRCANIETALGECPVFAGS